MTQVDTADLAVLALAGDVPASAGPEQLSVVELSDRMEMGAETMADRIELLSTLSDLEEQGLVQEQTTDDDRSYRLSKSGIQRARELTETFRDRRIEIRNGDRREITHAAVDAHLPSPALPRALARMTDEGVLYLDEGVEETFVDRQDELAVLEEALAALQSIDSSGPGEGRSILVTGQAGVGKTTLAEEALDRHEDVRVFEGVVQGDTDRPYQAVRDAIEPALEKSPFDRPSLDLENAEDLESLRTSLFADVADALVALATDQPVVLYLDDLHNAGQPTIELLEFLAGRVEEEPVLVVATARIEGVDDDHGVHELAADWSEEGQHHRLALSSFDREQTRQLLEVILGTRRLPGGFVDLLYEQTGGIPLFVEETCSRMQEEGLLAPEHDVFPTEADEILASGTLEETIEIRLAALDSEGERVLATAALLGEQFTLERLEAATDLEQAVVREYVTLLEDIGVLRWAGAEDVDAVWFQSGLFRETVVEGISEGQRREYHRRIATAVADFAGDDPGAAGTIAYHYEQAGDTDRALESWLQAAEHAESVYAQELAREHYDHALAIAREQDDRERVLDILESIGDVDTLLGNFDSARRAFEYVREKAPDVERQQRAARQIAEIQYMWADEPDTARDTIAEALAFSADDTVTAEECRLLVQQGRIIGGGFTNYEKAEQLLEEAISLAESLDDAELLGEALLQYTETMATRGAGDELLLERARRAVEIFEDLGDDRKLADAVHAVGWAHSCLGDFSTYIDYMEQSEQLNRETGNRMDALVSRFNATTQKSDFCLVGEYPADGLREELREMEDQARLLEFDKVLLLITSMRSTLAWQHEYDYDSSKDLMERVYSGLDDPRLKHHQAVGLACVHEWAGEFEQAGRYAAKATEAGTQYPQLIGHLVSARVAIHQENPGDAIADFENAVTVAGEWDNRHAEILARSEFLMGLIADSRLSRASEQAEVLERHLRESESEEDDIVVGLRLHKPSITVHRALGSWYRETGEFDIALETFQMGLETARDHEDRYREARLLFEIAETHRDRGDLDSAAEYVDEALAITPELGAFGEELERRNHELLGLRSQ